MTKRSEDWYPFVGGMLFFVVVVVLCSYFGTTLNSDTLKTLYEVTVNIGAIAIGFLSTILATLFSIRSSRTLRHIREADRYGQLIDYLLYPIYWYFGLVAMSMVGLVVASENLTTLTALVFLPWLLFVPVSFLESFRAMKIMVLILRE